jgi:hypothetical protein
MTFPLAPLVAWTIIPQPTAQYGQMVVLSRAYLILKVWAYALTGFKSMPRPRTITPAAVPAEIFKNSRRLTLISYLLSFLKNQIKWLLDIT